MKVCVSATARVGETKSMISGTVLQLECKTSDKVRFALFFHSQQTALKTVPAADLSVGGFMVIVVLQNVSVSAEHTGGTAVVRRSESAFLALPHDMMAVLLLVH